MHPISCQGIVVPIRVSRESGGLYPRVACKVCVGGDSLCQRPSAGPFSAVQGGTNQQGIVGAWCLLDTLQCLGGEGGGGAVMPCNSLCGIEGALRSRLQVLAGPVRGPTTNLDCNPHPSPRSCASDRRGGSGLQLGTPPPPVLVARQMRPTWWRRGSCQGVQRHEEGDPGAYLVVVQRPPARPCPAETQFCCGPIGLTRCRHPHRRPPHSPRRSSHDETSIPRQWRGSAARSQAPPTPHRLGS